MSTLECDIRTRAKTTGIPVKELKKILLRAGLEKLDTEGINIRTSPAPEPAAEESPEP